ncbi:hypothetical protein SNE25_21140 [Mucilaginibacter sabulilitoris]|uniref:TROVE domain-containing protein n=1 Tax=Mucilaginibacter sabulilitoris TaxID=1173583 RepID=A0ABZ0TF75_9SPHI|nr:hypothetical protein [Mucilaginibacter sabulilitoris]WPU91826.1 hypothetical protein SNE25_21140 [Mucilaginibacter sabulilitoris]
MKYSTLAKVIAKNDPEAYRNAVKVCEPMLNNPSKFLPEIHKAIKDIYPDIDRTDESILFMAVAYKAYAPATLLGQGVDRAPNGIRKVMCQIMGWNNETVCNFYQDAARAYSKGKSYQEKISAVLLGFEKFSIKSQQIELF